MAANDDFNVMQAQLGLTGGGGSMSPFGLQTPLPQPPQVRHPSEAARDAVQQSQAMAASTMQSSAMVNMAITGGGGGGGWGVGAFGQQFRQNMAGIQQQQLNPWAAGSMSAIMGQQGFSPGMMPSPMQMTNASMGIYRPAPPSPMGHIPPVPPMPMFPTPFTPQLSQSMFSSPHERNMMGAEYRGIQHTAFSQAVPGVLARMGVDAMGARTGAGLGAMMGARFGAMGAGIGASVGALAGVLGTDHLMGRGVQGMVDEMNPFSRLTHQTAQVRGMSQSFMLGGPNLGVNGRGMGGAGSAHLARMLDNTAGSSGFQRETGGMFSTQDLMRITQQSGNQGLLDMAQRPEQIAGQVKNIAKALKSFMQLASEPDVTEAIKQLGQMRHMGLSLSESMGAAQNAKMFSRMAGTSVRGVMENGGLPGAMVFQQQGLSAGLGMNVGMGAMGMARQSVAAGTYTP
ncbi:MAG: hypothetical protein H0U59_03315, partial [Gemmatimonadaceae bacterium]|nr:hypothetical protein [Gemmatimonadaceae bacterium]